MDLVGVKLIILALLLSGCICLGLMPFKLKRYPGYSETGVHGSRILIFTLLLFYFSSGLLLSVAFLYLLPSVRDGITDYPDRPTLRELCFLSGFVFLILVEEVISALLPATKSTFQRAGSSVRRRRPAETGPADSRATEVTATQPEMVWPEDQHAQTDQDETDDAAGHYNPKYRGRLKESVHKMFPNYHPSEPSKPSSAPASSATTSPSSSVAVRLLALRSQLTGDFLGTLLSLWTHAFFEGLVVGLTEDVPSAWKLFAVVAVHLFVQFFEAGFELANADSTLTMFLLFIVCLAAAPPIGLAVGIAASLHPGQSKSIIGLIQAFSGGVLLYTVVFEILGRERKVLFRFFGLIQSAVLTLGAIIMALFPVSGQSTLILDADNNTMLDLPAPVASSKSGASLV